MVVTGVLAVEHPGVDPLGPLPVGDRIVLATAGQQVVVMDPVVT